MPPLHRAAAKDGEKAAKSCLCRAVGAVEAATPQILLYQLTLSHPGWNYAHHITICPPPGFSDLPTALLGLQNCSGILYLNFC